MSPIPETRSENMNLNLSEYNSGATVLSSYPPVLFIELTQNCNLHCRMCRASSGYKPALNMDATLFNRIHDELFPLATIVDLRGWGESTVLKTLGKYVTQTALAGPKLRLVTNALAITPVLWQTLMEHQTFVVVSVDASSESTMSLLGRGSFKALLRSLSYGVAARAASESSGEIAFNTVVSSLNLDELSGIVNLAADHGVKRITLFPVVTSRKNPLNLAHRKKEIRPKVEAAAAAARELSIELRIGASLDEELVVADALPNRCSHPWEYCYIDFSGNVGYCDHLIGSPSLTLGNLNKSSFRDIWNNTQFQELRSVHVAARAQAPGALARSHPHCAWCYKRRYVDFEDRTNPAAACRVVSTSSLLPILPMHNDIPLQNRSLWKPSTWFDRK